MHEPPRARPRAPTLKETTCEERRRDLEPDPGQADRRGALRGAQAEPRRGVQEDRPADQRPRLPPRQGAAGGHRPPGRPRRRPRRGHQRRRPRRSTWRRSRRTTSSRWRSPRSRSPSSRTTRRWSSPPRSTSSPSSTLPAYDGLEAEVEDVEVTDADVEEQVQALRERFGTLTDVERAAADGDFVVIDLTATQDGEAVEGAEVCRHVLPGRPRRHARRPRRGPASA